MYGDIARPVMQANYYWQVATVKNGLWLVKLMMLGGRWINMVNNILDSSYLHLSVVFKRGDK